MTLDDLINGVRYEVQGNVIIKVETEHGDSETVYENHNGGGIFDFEVDEHMNRIINFIYTEIQYNEPVLVIELGGDSDEY